MATYTTVAAFEEHIEGWTTTNAAALERYLVRAERAIDRVLGPWPRDPDTGLKIDPGELTDAAADALSRATSEQAYHIITATDAQDAGPPLKRVSGPEFTEEYDTAAAAASTPDPNAISAAAALELEPLRYLLARTARGRP